MGNKIISFHQQPIPTRRKTVKRVKNNIAKTIISKTNLNYNNVSSTHKMKSHW